MHKLATFLFAVVVLLAGGESAYAAEPEWPWRYDHWPQQQPWQEDAPSVSALRFGGGEAPQPVDPQNWVNPDHMTWLDYRKPPGTNWADPNASGSVRTFRGALVLLDYPNQPFVVTQPQGSTVFANPSAEASNVPRTQVAQFYKDFLNTPGQLNRGHTLHEYWMEDSGGRYGVELTAFGPYTVPGKDHEYGIDNQFQRGEGCPSGDTCNRNIRTDGRAAWVADVGTEVPAQFDFIFFLSAGQDESSTWQEFGPIKFPTKEAVTDDFGPPDPALPNWSRTRYVEWTSWASGSSIWPNAGGGSSTQAESSGMAVFAHEFSHILGIADNYNNPFGMPPRRSYTGVWEMLSRGSFNGPGGPHSRWMIPPTGGASMGAQHMLRNKIDLEMVDEANLLRLSREALDESGLAVARVKARVVQPDADELSGINIAFDTGDKSPACDEDEDPFCDGGSYDNYTIEVVDRMGTDSFTPDSGVLLAKTKNSDEDAPFEWVIDANPQHIGMADYVLPDGTEIPITIGDYRQLSDALFHAGADSGSEFEFTDQANRLHFYVLDRHVSRGELSYTVAIRSLDGSGPQRRGVRVLPAAGLPTGDGWARCRFPLHNSGRAAVAGTHPEDVSKYLRSDVYRLSAATNSSGWSVWLPNRLATAEFGRTEWVTAYARRDSGSGLGRITLTATSESDGSKSDTGTCLAVAR
jgi:M6 family metalloprotease-like protein